MARTRKPASATESSEPRESATAPEAAEPETTTDYTRCGGHVLTDYGWVLEKPEEESDDE